MNTNKMKTLLLDVLFDFAGSLLIGISVNFFTAPNHMAPGGVTGIATLVNYLTGIPIGTMSFLINVPLMIIAFLYLGRHFSVYTLKSMTILSLSVDFVALIVRQRNHRRHGNMEMKDDPIFLIGPGTLDAACRGIPGGLREAELTARMRRDAKLPAFEGNAAGAAEKPARDRAVGVVIQGIMHGAVRADAVPALPDGGRAFLYGVEPARTFILQKQPVGDVRAAVVGKNGQ